MDDVTAICETIKMGVRWTMPNSKAANVSDVFGSVVPGGPPGKPTTVGSQGNQSNCANVSSKCESDVHESDKCESPHTPNGAAAAAATNPPPIPSTGGLVYKKAWEIED